MKLTYEDLDAYSKRLEDKIDYLEECEDLLCGLLSLIEEKKYDDKFVDLVNEAKVLVGMIVIQEVLND